MATAPVINPIGGLDITKGDSITTANFPSVGATITIVKISEAPRIWRKDYKQDGSIVQENGTDRYTRGNQRGVWIQIEKTGVTYLTGINKNVPVLYKEGEEIKILANTSYLFLSDCRLEYGE